MGIKIYIYTLEKSKDEIRDKDVDKQAFLGDALRLYLSSDTATSAVISSPELNLSLGKGEHGKPYFDSTQLKDIHFSISHSGKYWGIAFSDKEVGFDIEDYNARRHDNKRYMKISKRFFTPEEVYFVDQSYTCEIEKNEDVKEISHIDFFTVWTRKEAYIKYTGKGLRRGLKTFSVIEPKNPESEANFFDGIGVVTLIKTDDMVCSCCGEETYIKEKPTVEFVSIH